MRIFSALFPREQKRGLAQHDVPKFARARFFMAAAKAANTRISDASFMCQHSSNTSLTVLFLFNFLHALLD